MAKLVNFAKVMGKYLGPTACDVIEKRHRYRRFPVSFANFFRTAFLYNTSGQLLLIDVSNYVYLKISLIQFNPMLHLETSHMKGLLSV